MADDINPMDDVQEPSSRTMEIDEGGGGGAGNVQQEEEQNIELKEEEERAGGGDNAQSLFLCLLNFCDFAYDYINNKYI